MIVKNDSPDTKAEKISRESKSSVLNQLASVLVLGDDLITYGVDSFRPTIMKKTIPL